MTDDTVSNERIGIDEGSHTILRYTIPDDDPIVSLAGVEIEWWMFPMLSPGAGPLIRKTVGNGIEITDPEARVFEVSLDPGDTFSIPGSYLYEAAVKDINGRIGYYAAGVIVVLPTQIRFV